MAKKLIINCASCDARNIREEDYAHYEAISVDAATVLLSPESKAVINRLPLTLNCANVVEIGRDVQLRIINGRGEIKSEDAVPDGKFYLLVNGALTIGPDTQKQLAMCSGMSVNGSLNCPESISAALNGVKVNGSVNCYPDGAIVLKRSAVIDRLFALRARPGLYWAGRRMIMVDPELDAEALRGKGASFSAGEFIVAQSKVEALLDLIDENAELILVPDGTSVVLDDITLDKAALRRRGNKLYVIGDVTVPEDGGVLAELEYLNVRGDILVPQEHREKLLETLTEHSGEVKLTRPRGMLLEDKPFVKLSRRMLEQQPQGIEVSGCALVKLAEDIPNELIAERLHIEDCAVVECSEEQEAAVALVCEDVAQISSQGPDGKLLDGLKSLADTKTINAAEYVL